MGGGGAADRNAPARLYAALGGGLLVVAGLAGMFAEASFATGDALVSARLLGVLEVNGWQSLLYIAAGMAGLALSVPAPRTACLGAAVLWTALAGFGFFGAHGGEAIHSMGDRLLAEPSDNVLALALAALAWAALAASRPSKPTGNARARESGSDPSEESRSVDRPRTARRSRGSRGVINR